MFTLSEQHLTDIEKHGEETFPHECCGFIFGVKDADGTLQTRELRRAENQRKDRGHDRFEIHPRDYMKAERYADSAGMQIIGYYHSHPNSPAIPSQFDIDHAWPTLVYTITEVRDGKAVVTYAHQLTEDRKQLKKINMNVEEKSHA